MDKLKQLCKNPYRLFSFLAMRGLFNWLPDKPYLKLLYRSQMGKKLDLENPKTFNEKLQWLKIYDRKPEYVQMVDKYEAKKYVAERIGEKYIIPTLGVWDRFEDIDFDALPDQFVLKCTHDSGGLVICRDKTNLDKAAAKEKIEQSLRKNYYHRCREWPYKDVQPRILAEQYMEETTAGCVEGLTDYKFYCFDGEPRFLYVSKGLEDHSTARISFLELDWSFSPFVRSDYKPFDELPAKPKNYEAMLDVAKKLSSGIAFLRVDLYEIAGKIYFSELTFSPCGGMIPFGPESWDLELGKMVTVI